MSLKLYLILGGVLCVGASFAGYKLYDYGYTKAYAEAKVEYDKELSKVKSEAEEERLKVSELEKKMYEASAEYESLNTRLVTVLEDNEKWKREAEESNHRAFDISTVRRLNQILSSQ